MSVLTAECAKRAEKIGERALIANRREHTRMVGNRWRDALRRVRGFDGAKPSRKMFVKRPDRSVGRTFAFETSDSFIFVILVSVMWLAYRGKSIEQLEGREHRIDRSVGDREIPTGATRETLEKRAGVTLRFCV